MSGVIFLLAALTLVSVRSRTRSHRATTCNVENFTCSKLTISKYAISFVLIGLLFGMPTVCAQQITLPDSGSEISDESLMLGDWNSDIAIAPDLSIEPTNSITIELDESSDDDAELLGMTFGDWLGYNSVQDDTTWLFGNEDDLGMFSLRSYPTLDLGESGALTTGIGIHFLTGPVRTDLPPRLFDFDLAYHTRWSMAEKLMMDVKWGVGAYSDFEGSAREGVRQFGHAVGYFEVSPWLVTVLGVDVLGRDDYNVLPVGGLVIRPTENSQFELVFPKPRVLFRTSSTSAVYVSGELGGGTWAIERVGGIDDVATYKDLRILLGAISYDDDDDTSLEFGWAFDRRLSYRSGLGDYQPDSAFLLQLRVHY